MSGPFSPTDAERQRYFDKIRTSTDALARRVERSHVSPASADVDAYARGRAEGRAQTCATCQYHLEARTCRRGIERAWRNMTEEEVKQFGCTLYQCHEAHAVTPTEEPS